MTRVRSESGAISILNVIIMLVLLIALGFAFELSAALDQQNAQTNDCSAARDATMASQNLLVAKNSDDPGLAIATAAVKSLRANGFNGEVEVWFYEAPSSAVPQSKRAWAWGIQTKSSLKGYFATYSPQAPRQDTVSTVKSISSDVCLCSFNPSSLYSASRIGMDLRT